MNLKKLGSKVKGFTLVEMLIVMAIIGVLAGMISLFASGFQRDAKIESNNNKAKLIYTAFQNILINCEIQQDDEVLDVGRYVSTPIDEDISFAHVYFEMDQTELGDNVMVVTRYVDGSQYNVALKNDDTDVTYKGYQVIEEAITSYLDNSFEGTGVVYIDYEDFMVESVIYYEPNTFEGDLSAYTASIMPAMAELNSYADFYEYTGKNHGFRMLNSLADQRKYYKYVGSHLGAYPKFDDYDEDDDSAPELVP